MKTLRALALLATLATIGCSQKAQTFHVTSATPDAPIDVTGTFEGKEYSLSVNRQNVPLYIAYYEPIGTADVGKDFHATLDNGKGDLLIDVPKPDGTRATVRYTIESARAK
jgi:hypothetical protein